MNRKPNIFSKLLPELRRHVASFVSECRRRDRGENSLGVPWLSQTRSLNDYCNRLEVSKAYINAFIQSRIKEESKVSVLDIGVGHGEALHDLSSMYGDLLYLSGVGLTQAIFHLKNYVHRIGLIETLGLGNNIHDLVFSVRGGFSYTLHSFAAIEEVLNSLKEGGVAFLEDSRLLLSKEWFRVYLSAMGFRLEETRYQDAKPVCFKIVKPRQIYLDLSSFKERYVGLLNSYKDVFLVWGFDRIQKNSPVTSLFQSLYSAQHYGDLITL